MAANEESADASPLRWSCPACRGDLHLLAPAARCPACGATYRVEEGVWRFLDPAQAPTVATFTREYAVVREAEGWRHDDDAYFRALPAVPPGDPHAALWRRRARSYDLLLRRVLAPLEAAGRPLAILDLGAGNCWLAHRLAARGHRVAAIDLLTSDWDGLGAHRRYRIGGVTPVQATFDRLPLAAASVDLAIFNASIHYAADYATTLAEALRTLRPDGQLVILDSPLYRDDASGARMVGERAAAFLQRYGFPSDALGGLGYLTHARLRDLDTRLNIHWRILDVSSPVRRSLRRTLNRLRRQREFAAMPLIVGHCPTGSRPPRPRRASPQPLLPPPSPITRARRRVFRRLARWRYLAFQRHRHDTFALERVHGTPLLVLPAVFNPRLFHSSAFLAGALDEAAIPPGSSVLDMGTGSGVGAIFAARRAGRVLAVDINPAAVRCAAINALMHHLEGRIEVREGDLFAPVGGERFDTVLFNPPYFRGSPASALDRAWRSNDVVERFAAGLRDHLSPLGHALVVLSTDGDSPAFLRAFAAHGFAIAVVARRDFGNEVVTVYELAVGSRQ